MVILLRGMQKVIEHTSRAETGFLITIWHGDFQIPLQTFVSCQESSNFTDRAIHQTALNHVLQRKVAYFRLIVFHDDNTNVLTLMSMTCAPICHRELISELREKSSLIKPPSTIFRQSPPSD